MHTYLNTLASILKPFLLMKKKSKIQFYYIITALSVYYTFIPITAARALPEGSVIFFYANIVYNVWTLGL